MLRDSALSPLFQATREATEEAILNSLLRATTVSGYRGRVVEAIPIDRVSEIEAIFQDLEERRLRALYEGDEEAFKSLFANKNYMQRSLALFNLVEFTDEWQMPSLAVASVLADEEECIAVLIEWNYSRTFVGADPAEAIEVVELVDDEWRVSYSGEGWTCDGPHPLSP